MQTALLLALTFASGANEPTADGGADEAAMMALGRSLSEDFWAGRLEPVWARMDAAMRDALGDKPVRLSEAREQILTLAGGPGETLQERIGQVRGIPVYLRIFRGANGSGPLLEQWAIENNAVAGFYVRPTELKPEAAPTKQMPSTPKYLWAALVLAATALAMVGLQFLLRRTPPPP